jgi:hypothetical protein
MGRVEVKSTLLDHRLKGIHIAVKDDQFKYRKIEHISD